ncbi:hypothetical protein ACIHCM_22575 [Streptomyces sp. NPDC052023]|uniref:hypothetical protein n=1 Tax=Streptomyces sp. NPDC052023 TaxID=3365681 RepID=UPI0037D08197
MHGLHYVGDQLGLLARAASWLVPDGLLIGALRPALGARRGRLTGRAGGGAERRPSARRRHGHYAPGV